MNAKQSTNKHVQVTELGTATELTLGCGWGQLEGARGRRGGRQQQPKTQVTELGTASELTLGSIGPLLEGSFVRPRR